MSKKIAIIIERADVVLGGAERSIFELSSALTAAGMQVDILAATGRTSAKHIHLLCPNARRVGLKTFSAAIKKHLENNQYDIVHSVLPFDFADIYQPRGGSYAETIIQNAASYQSPAMAIYKRITSFFNFRRAVLLRAEKKLCKKPDGPIVAALSDYVADQFKRHYGLPDHRIRVIPNGVKIHKDIDTSSADKLRSQILAHLKIKEADEPVLLLFAANNFRLKGLAPLLKALALAHCPKTYLVIAGRGRSYKYRLLARKLNIHRKILFLGKLRHIQNALSICDVAILPTFYDPASRFILEALACGKPVITTGFNGAADMFTSDRHGKTVKSPLDITALALAIQFFSDKTNIKNASQTIAADNLEENISISRVADQLNNLYDSIIKKREQK
ncbi:MAG: glycosyltransferase family 4 protein [Phycisphaerae bacterium]|nr:glycosyltransferase family 4 protein [Phycisphaerae bacterium]